MFLFRLHSDTLSHVSNLPLMDAPRLGNGEGAAAAAETGL